MDNVVDLCSVDDSFEWSPAKKTPVFSRKRTANENANNENFDLLGIAKKRRGQTPIDLTLSDRKNSDVDRSVFSIHSTQSGEKRFPLQPVASPARPAIGSNRAKVVELLDSPLRTLLDANSRCDGFSPDSFAAETERSGCDRPHSSCGAGARSPVPQASTTRAQNGPNGSLFARLTAAKQPEARHRPESAGSADDGGRRVLGEQSAASQRSDPPLSGAVSACDEVVVEVQSSLPSAIESADVESAEEGSVVVACGSAADFEVRLLVDRRERANNLVLASLQTLGVRCEAANLAVGDFLFVARRMAHGLYEATESAAVAGDTLVLDRVVVERKAVADLAASLLDGRFSDQKRRLKMTRIQRCIVLVEGESMLLPPQMQRVLTAQHLKTAMVNAYADHDIHIVRTRNMDHSIAFLRTLFRQVSHDFAEQLRPSPVAAPAAIFLSLRRYQELYRARSADNLSELFGQQLRQIHGCGASAAHAIVSRYGTLAHFVWHLRSIGRLNAQVSEATATRLERFLTSVSYSASWKICIVATRRAQPARRITRRTTTRTRRRTAAAAVDWAAYSRSASCASFWTTIEPSTLLVSLCICCVRETK